MFKRGHAWEGRGGVSKRGRGRGKEGRGGVEGEWVGVSLTNERGTLSRRERESVE